MPTSIFARRAPWLLAALTLSCSGAGENAHVENSTPAPQADATPAPPAPEPLPSGRLPDLARPLGYHVALSVDPRQENYSGTVQIDLDVARPTRGLVLHARGMRVESARLIPGASGSDAAAITATATSRAAVGGIGEPEELVLAFDRNVPAGRARLAIAYTAPFDRGLRGLYRVHVGDDWYAFTDCEPADERRMMPSFDEPGFKVPWEVSLTIPEGQTAAANMPEVSREPAAQAGQAGGERMVTVHFAPTPPTSSYLVAFTVGPFDVVPRGQGTLPVRVIGVRGSAPLAHTALETAAAEVDILADYFGRPYPYPKLDLVAVPEFGPGAMENPGLITFRDDLLLLDPAHATTRARRGLAAVAAHELAHQWFGDLVTMAWWDDVWLNEAFATWMQSKVVDRWQPNFGASVDAVRSRGGAMETDSLTSARAVRQPVTNTSQAMEAFDSITYEKGAAVLSMLESWVGPDVFRQGVRDYLHQHEWSNATASDLFSALSQASGKDVGSVAGTFLDQSGVPLVTADLACPAGAPPTLRISQSRYQIPTGAAAHGEPSTTRWKIPVCVQYPTGGANNATARSCTVLDGESASVPLEGLTACPAWVHPNADEAGYYRYTMPPAVRALLAPERLPTLDVRTRLGLLDDAWALVRGGQMPVDQFMAVLDAYRADRARPIIEEVTGIMYALADQVAEPASRAAIATYISGYLAPIAREVGWDPQPSDDDDKRLIRRAVLSILATRGEDAAINAEAERRATAYLADPHSVDADAAAIAVPAASRRAGADRLAALIAALPHAPTPGDRSILLSGIGSFENPDVLRQALDATLTDAIRVGDAARVIFNATNAPARRPVAIAWLQQHFDALRHRLADDMLGYFPGTVASACSADEIQHETAYWQPHATEFQGAERHLREATERAVQCQTLRARESAGLATYLAHAHAPATAPAAPAGDHHGRAHGDHGHGDAHPARGSAQHRKPIS